MRRSTILNDNCKFSCSCALRAYRLWLNVCCIEEYIIFELCPSLFLSKLYIYLLRLLFFFFLIFLSWNVYLWSCTGQPSCRFFGLQNLDNLTVIGIGVLFSRHCTYKLYFSFLVLLIFFRNRTQKILLPFFIFFGLQLIFSQFFNHFIALFVFFIIVC